MVDALSDMLEQSVDHRNGQYGCFVRYVATGGDIGAASAQLDTAGWSVPRPIKKPVV